MKLKVHFNLPFRFVDEGKYELSHKKVAIKIHVKLMQNFEAAEKIMGMTIETSGEGSKVDMNADYHGMVNFTHIEMEMSDNIHWALFNAFLMAKAGMSADILIKIHCMQLVNHLAEVIRTATNNYWIRFVSLRDIMKFQIWYFLLLVEIMILMV